MKRDSEPLGFRYAYRDFLFALVIVFLALFAIVKPHAKSTKTPNQGALIISMHWSMKSNSDVDLWVKSPGDYPVGYSHLTGKYCDLVRDDLGRELDPASHNEEMTICRQTPAGEYIVNAMMYRSYDLVFPVRVTVTVRSMQGGKYRRIVRRSIELNRDGEEKTLFRFRLTAKGALVPGSINHLQAKLYAKAMAR